MHGANRFSVDSVNNAQARISCACTHHSASRSRGPRAGRHQRSTPRTTRTATTSNARSTTASNSAHSPPAPARARAAVALYLALAIDANNRALAGAYRGVRLVTPTLGLYGTVRRGVCAGALLWLNCWTE